MFKLNELTETAHQNSNPKFPELLNRVCVGEQTQSGIAAIHAMADTDISDWPESHFRSYMINHLVGKRNVEVMNNAINTVFTIYVVD